mgnify:CR=1 FL=1
MWWSYQSDISITAHHIHKDYKPLPDTAVSSFSYGCRMRPPYHLVWVPQASRIQVEPTCPGLKYGVIIIDCLCWLNRPQKNLQTFTIIWLYYNFLRLWNQVNSSAGQDCEIVKVSIQMPQIYEKNFCGGCGFNSAALYCSSLLFGDILSKEVSIRLIELSQWPLPILSEYVGLQINKIKTLDDYSIISLLSIAFFK